jgi:psiF repeat
MKTFARFALAGSFVIGLSVTGFAQAPAPAPAAPAAPAPAKPKATKPMDAGAKALAKECSAKASAQGLHGKARKEFREKCKKGEM